MRRSIIAAIALCACAAVAWGKDEAPDDAQAKDKKKDKDEMVCERVRVTGTHFKQRICRTRGQMEAEREAARRQAERYNPPGAGAPAG